jgi:hypothetical protein
MLGDSAVEIGTSVIDRASGTNLPLTQSLEIQSYIILGEFCFLVEWVVYV